LTTHDILRINILPKSEKGTLIAEEGAKGNAKRGKKKKD